jgi:hypothetical protein
MNQSEVPLEPVAEAIDVPGGERLALYRVRPSAGPVPYGGREAARVPRHSQVSRLLAPVTDSIASVEAGGEGRGRATLRVAGSALALGFLALGTLLLLLASGLLAAAGRIHTDPGEAAWATRARAVVGRGLRWLGRRWTVRRTALERPLREATGAPKGGSKGGAEGAPC